MTINTPRVPFFATPPLRWVGAKWQLAEWIISTFPPHEVYCEPFAGSAAVFFRKHRSSVEVLNDLDGELVNFFRVLRNCTDELLFKIRLTPWSEHELNQSFESCDDDIERARRFYVSLWQSFGSTLVQLPVRIYPECVWNRFEVIDRHFVRRSLKFVKLVDRFGFQM